MPTGKIETGISYFGNRVLKYVSCDMREIVKSHCTYVIHTFSEYDLQYYKGTVEKIVSLTHKAGLKAHLDPWGVAGIFGGEAYTNYACRNLDARQVISNNEIAPVACLNNIKTREFIKKWVDAAIEIGADVIFWDEPHFFLPRWLGYEDMTLWGCRCNVCSRLFKERFGYEMPALINEDVIKFKYKSVVSFLREMCDYVKSKGILNSVCLLPGSGDVESEFWDDVAKIESLDNIGTDPYWTTQKKREINFDFSEFIRTFCRKIKRLSEKYDKKGHIWIQNFKIPYGWEKDVEIAVDIAYKEGIRDIAAWSYDGTSFMSSRSCERPELVWKILGNCYKKLHKISRK